MSYYVEKDYAGAVEAAMRALVRYPLQRYPGKCFLIAGWLRPSGSLVEPRGARGYEYGYICCAESI